MRAGAEVTIERLTFGGDALAHDDGQIVFVPYGAPGDRVRVRPVARHQGWVRGEIETVLAPGPGRVLPGCRWFPTCGGCQWQHVAPDTQRDAKRAIVTEQLARGAGVRDAEVLPTRAPPAAWGHRARVTLVAEGRRLGFHRARSHSLVEIDDCPVAAPAITAHLDAARVWVRGLRTAVERVTIAAAPGGVVLVAALAMPPGPRDLEHTEALLTTTATVRGAVLGGGGVRQVVGDPRLHVPLEDELALEVPADVFTQVNPEANRLLVASVVALGNVAAGSRVIDCYAGAGNFTLPLARRGAHVVGVERDPLAVAAARENAKRLGITQATFREGSAAAALSAEPPGAIDTVVLDPPRAGAASAIAPLARLRPRRIVYVSCEPSTLARDVRALLARGWRVGRVQPVDLFPQTYHVETVAELHLT